MSENNKSILNKLPLEWPLKYWIVIASIIGGPQAASFGFNFIGQQPQNIRELESNLQTLAEQTERLAEVNREVVEVQIRHDEKIKAIGDGMSVKFSDLKQELLDIRERLLELEKKH